MKIRPTDINPTGASANWTMVYNGTTVTWATIPSDSTKAPLASPAFTGTPVAPTPATADNSTTIATTAFVKAQGYGILSGTQSWTGSNTFTNTAQFQAVVTYGASGTGSLVFSAGTTTTTGQIQFFSHSGTRLGYMYAPETGTFANSLIIGNDAGTPTYFLGAYGIALAFGSFGYITLKIGDATHTGYMEYTNGSGVRQAYTGYTTTGGKFNINSDTGGGISLIPGAGSVSVDGGTGLITLSNSGDGSYYRSGGASGAIFFNSSGTKYLYNTGAQWQFSGQGLLIGGVTSPAADNTYTLGQSGFRWSQLWAGTATINTSDARVKTIRGPLTSDEIAAAKDIGKAITVYQFNDAIERKGADKARLHVGVIAQEVVSIMASHGLDATRYSFLCWDEWEASETLGANGEVVSSIEKGDRYGIRYEELNQFLMAALYANL